MRTLSRNLLIYRRTPLASLSTASLEAWVSTLVSSTVMKSEAVGMCRNPVVPSGTQPGWKTKWIKDSSRNLRQRGMWDSFRVLQRLI